jgi:hypothetical protein
MNTYILEVKGGVKLNFIKCFAKRVLKKLTRISVLEYKNYHKVDEKGFEVM